MENAPSRFISHIEHKYTGAEVTSYIVTWKHRLTGVESFSTHTGKENMDIIDRFIAAQKARLKEFYQGKPIDV